MPDIGQIGPSNGASQCSKAGVDRSDSDSGSRPIDISTANRDRLREQPAGGSGPGQGDSRRSRLESIRAAIADGTYATEDRLRIAMQRMIDDLRR